MTFESKELVVTNIRDYGVERAGIKFYPQKTRRVVVHSHPRYLEMKACTHLRIESEIVVPFGAVVGSTEQEPAAPEIEVGDPTTEPEPEAAEATGPEDPAAWRTQLEQMPKKDLLDISERLKVQGVSARSTNSDIIEGIVAAAAQAAAEELSEADRAAMEGADGDDGNA